MANINKCFLTKYNIIIFTLILIAAALRIWGLGNFDISPDEHHFIQDAYRYFTNDPYMVPRHHPFRHGVPFVGHPSLGQDLMQISFWLFSPSVFSGRLVMTMSNLFAVIGTYVLARMLFDKKIALLSLFLIVFLPHDIRYARDAHLDPLLEASLVWAVIFFWKMINSKEIHWGGWVGLASALVMTSKINGPFLFVFYGVAILLHTKIKNLPLWLKEHFKQIIVATLFFSILFFLIVDPKSYLDALINPADPEIATISKILSPFLHGGVSFMAKIIFYLYSLPFVILVLFGFFILIKRHKPADLFLFTLFIVYSHIFITHSGHSGEYGYITLNPYFVLMVSVALLYFKPVIRKLALAMVLIFFAPLLILHGLRVDVGPFTQLTHFNDSNFRYGQRPYRNAIAAINEITPPPVVLWVKDSDRQVPMMDIKGGVQLWPFFELNSVDTVLLADAEKKSELISNNEFYQYREFDYKGMDKVWILRRTNTINNSKSFIQ